MYAYLGGWSSGLDKPVARNYPLVRRKLIMLMDVPGAVTSELWTNCAEIEAAACVRVKITCGRKVFYVSWGGRDVPKSGLFSIYSKYRNIFIKRYFPWNYNAWTTHFTVPPRAHAQVHIDVEKEVSRKTLSQSKSFSNVFTCMISPKFGTRFFRLLKYSCSYTSLSSFQTTILWSSSGKTTKSILVFYWIGFKLQPNSSPLCQPLPYWKKFLYDTVFILLSNLLLVSKYQNIFIKRYFPWNRLVCSIV